MTLREFFHFKDMYYWYHYNLNLILYLSSQLSKGKAAWNNARCHISDSRWFRTRLSPRNLPTDFNFLDGLEQAAPRVA